MATEVVESLEASFGVEVSGWTDDIELLRSLLDRHRLVVLRQVCWTESSQLAVTRSIGQIVARRTRRLRRVVPNVRVELGADLFADRWHADLSWSSIDAISVLSCTHHESDAEPTLFCDTSSLFDRLHTLPTVDPLIRAMADRSVHHDVDNSRRLRPATTTTVSAARGLRRHRYRVPLRRPAIDRTSMVLPGRGGPQGTEHRLIDVTVDGRRHLRVGDHAWSIEGLAVEDSAVVLQQLTDAATNAAYVYSHPWVAGDAVLYDNRMILHRRFGVAGTDPRRRLLRTMAVSRRLTE